jgi:hypothetical protein
MWYNAKYESCDESCKVSEKQAFSTFRISNPEYKSIHDIYPHGVTSVSQKSYYSANEDAPMYFKQNVMNKHNGRGSKQLHIPYINSNYI